MAEFTKITLKRNRDEEHPLVPSKKVKRNISRIRGQGPAERFAVIQRFFQVISATHAVSLNNTPVQIPESLVDASAVADFSFDGSVLKRLDDDKFDYGKQQAEVFLSAILSYATAFPVCDVEHALSCCECNKTCAETPYLLTRFVQSDNVPRCSVTNSDRFVSRPLLDGHQPDPQRCSGEAVCVNCLWSSFVEPSLEQIDFLRTWCAFDSSVSKMAQHEPAPETCICSVPLPDPKHAGSSQSHSMTCLFEFSVVTDDTLLVLKKQALQALRASGPTSHFVFDDPDLMKYIRKRKDSRNQMDEHIASLSQLLHQFGAPNPAQEYASAARTLPAPPAPAPDADSPFQDTIKQIEIYRERIKDLSDGQDDFLMPFFAEEMNRMLQCRYCGNFGHENGRACPLFHNSFFPKAGSDYTNHHKEFYGRNIDTAKTAMLEFTDRVRSFLKALDGKMQEAPRPPGQLKSREIYNSDGSMLQRHIDMGLNSGKGKDLAKTTKNKGPLDGSENPHNRIRNCFQKKERNMSFTAWFGAPFSYLAQMIDNNLVPSTFLDMISFSNPSEMSACISMWQNRGYDTSDMECFYRAFTSPLDGVPDADNALAASQIMELYAQLIDANTEDRDGRPLTEYGRHLKIERAYFFDNMIQSCVQFCRTNEFSVNLDYVTVCMSEDRVREILRANQEYRPVVVPHPRPFAQAAPRPSRPSASPSAPRSSSSSSNPPRVTTRSRATSSPPDEFPVPVSDPDCPGPAASEAEAEPQPAPVDGDNSGDADDSAQRPSSLFGGDTGSGFVGGDSMFLSPTFHTTMTPAYSNHQFAYSANPLGSFLTPWSSALDGAPFFPNIDLDQPMNTPRTSPRKEKAYRKKKAD